MSSDNDTLEAGNHVFKEVYGAARDSIRDQVPILVVMPTELALYQQGQRRLIPYSRPVFAQARSAAHIAVALFSLTGTESSAADRRPSVTALHAHITGAVAEPQHGPLQDEINVLLRHCLWFAELALENRLSDRMRAEFAREAGPRILHITELATGEQIAGLHQAVEATLNRLCAREQAELQIVVVGDHQARARSLGMQYFKRRFGEEPGADGRVTYGENISDEQAAVSLVATRRLDQRIALAFFGDEKRLQRDVLGDAAKGCLDRMCW